MLEVNESRILLRARKLLRAQLINIPVDKTPVIALSGGADSLALAFAANLEGVKIVHIIDHGLQAVTAQVALDTAHQVEAWGMKAIITCVNVNDGNSAQTGGMENAARKVRYEALLADPSHVVFLAHTMRDQAETVLMGLGRGSGTRSLQGMKSVAYDGRIIRPFLTLTREDMELICEQFDLNYWSDPQNKSDNYRRVRVRNELLPLMEDILGGGVETALTRTALLLQEDNEALDLIAHNAYTLNVKELALLPNALRRRIIRSFLLTSGVDPSKLTHVHIIGVEALSMDWRGQKGISVPGGQVKRINNELMFEAI